MGEVVTLFDDPKVARAATERAQARATSPDGSAWVSANAGTGKTYVLVRRVLRLLLAGAAPEGIVCLTFTKAAASEMSNRLTRELGAWATTPEDELRETLGKLLDRAPQADEIVLARRLFARVLETAGGLKIQTIHSFCERILRLFPLEARVAPGFSVLAEEDSRARLRQAAAEVLDEAADAPGTVLGDALQSVIRHVGEEQFNDILSEVLAKREVIATMLRHADDTQSDLEALIAGALGVEPGGTPEALLAAQSVVLDSEALNRALVVLGASDKASDARLAEQLRKAQRAARIEDKVDAFAQAFLTKAGEPRSDRGFPTSDVINESPDVAASLRRARDDFAELERQRLALTVAQASDALVTLAEAVILRYEAGKAVDALLDYDDLIERTLNLLSRGTEWVLFRLDGGIDHILIDEAQDNSPVQWQVVELLSREFFAGMGAREEQRTVFAVGDEKQSIYGFQGAAPAHFARMGELFRRRAEASAKSWNEVQLTLSFRTVDPVLRAVDLVFGNSNLLPGGAGEFANVRHQADRQGHAGLVEVWPTEKPDERPETSPWEPLNDGAGSAEPVERVAARIADQIKDWLDSGEVLPSCGRPIRPGDILILIRKRKPFAEPMIRALKERGIPVAGADRMRLIDQMAVMDLVALGDVLLLREDDLTLATVLKSPIFGFDDDDLFAIGHGRQGSFWAALERAGESNERYREAADTLERWRAAAGSMPPFEFYLARLEADGLRGRLLRRLGPEAADAIDEFLNLALHYEEIAPASLQGFLHWLRQSGIEVRRDMEQHGDQVRVMTVHGAKGLEANIVFLPDTCSRQGGMRSPLVTVENEDVPPPWRDHLIWRVPGSSGIPAVRSALDSLKAAEHAEYYRLLYVAMTRARDRLYVTGFENRTKQGRDTGCWYDVIHQALEADAVRVPSADGQQILRLETEQTVPASYDRAVLRSAGETEPPPSWLEERAHPEASRQVVTPTSLGRDADVTVETVAPLSSSDSSAPSADDPRMEIARIRGLLVHRLLELLPQVPPDEQKAAAERLTTAHGEGVPEAERVAIVEKVLAILRAPEYAHLFGPQSRAEVPIAALRPAASAGGADKLVGQIDRLAINGDEVLVVDYKTGRAVPNSADDVPEPYVRQLAAYREALDAVFPGKRIRTFLLWTEGPSIMEIVARPSDKLSQPLDGRRPRP